MAALISPNFHEQLYPNAADKTSDLPEKSIPSKDCPKKEKVNYIFSTNW